MTRSVTLLGLDYADLGADAVAALIEARDAAARFAYVVTPNADHLVRLSRRPALRPLYADAWLRVLDSRVVSGTARAFGLAVPRVCPGSDLVARLVAALPAGAAVTVIGASAGALARLGLGHAAQHVPPFGFENDPAAFRAAVDFVLAHPARYVLFAVGSPRQEMLAHAVAASGRATGTGLCIGAALAFAAGELRRAPGWMQRGGMEWLHRLGSDPRRMARRYLLDCPRIFPLLLHAASRTDGAPDVPAAGEMAD